MAGYDHVPDFLAAHVTFWINGEVICWRSCSINGVLGENRRRQGHASFAFEGASGPIEVKSMMTSEILTFFYGDDSSITHKRSRISFDHSSIDRSARSLTIKQNISMMAGPLKKCRIDLLPNEILKMIMGQCDGVTVLYALVRSDSGAQTLFEGKAISILTDVLRSSTMHHHLRNMLCSILSLRHILCHDGSRNTLQDCVDKFIDCPSIEIRLDLNNLLTYEAMNVLSFAAELCESVTRAERSFVRVRLSRIISRLESKSMQDRYYQTARYESISLGRRPASQEELHRVRRALWRLHLYYMAFYMPYIALNEYCRGPGVQCLIGKVQENTPVLAWAYYRRSELDHLKKQKGFFGQMTV